MFADIEADIYIMADGDDTYDALAAPGLVRTLIDDQLDMIIATRLNSYENTETRAGHTLGNKLLTTIVNVLFSRSHKNILSGYRFMSRRFVKTIPVMAKGFEVETLLTIHAHEIAVPIWEIETNYKNRGEDSVSKLNTYRDAYEFC